MTVGSFCLCIPPSGLPLDLTLEQEMLFGSIGPDLPSGELPRFATLLYRSVPAACHFMSDASFAKLRRWRSNCTPETPSHYIETLAK